MAKSSKPRSKPGAKAAWATARDPKAGVAARVAAISTLSRSLDDKTVFDGVLALVRDTAEPSEVRLATLAMLQAASFSSIKFTACRPRYVATLRAISEDPDLELRQRVLGLLAREKDARTQERLLAGLRDPAKALVPPEKALQLLSYDLHAATYPVARAIVKDPPSEAAKREALRLLAADASAAPVFEKVLRDKREVPELRQLSASALHALAPQALQTAARAIVLDDDDEDIQATSLTALAQFGDADKIERDDKLHARVQRLHGRANKTMKQSAKQFIDRYRRS